MRDAHIHLFISRAGVLFALFLLVAVGGSLLKKRRQLARYWEGLKFLLLGGFTVSTVLLFPLKGDAHFISGIHRALLLQDNTYSFVAVHALALGYCGLLLGLEILLLVSINKNQTPKNPLRHNKAL